MAKEDVLNNYHSKIAQAESDLYDEAQAAGYERGYAKGIEDAGAAQPTPVPVPSQPVEDTTPFDQAALDAAVAKAKEEQQAIDAEILEAAKASMSQQIADLQIQLSQKDADALEEAVADELETLAADLRERTVPVEVPAPQPVPPVQPSPSEPVQPAPPQDGGEVVEEPSVEPAGPLEGGVDTENPNIPSEGTDPKDGGNGDVQPSTPPEEGLPEGRTDDEGEVIPEKEEVKPAPKPGDLGSDPV